MSIRGYKVRFSPERAGSNAVGSLVREYRIDIEDANKRISDGIVPEELREDHLIPNGILIYRVSDQIDTTRKGPVYVSYLDVDRWNWKHGLSVPCWEHTFRLNTDLHIPSRKRVYHTVHEILQDRSELVLQSVKDWLAIHQQDPDNLLARKSIPDTMKRYQNMDSGESAFFCMQTLGINTELKTELIRRLSALGYNAITDEAGLGGQSGTDLDGADPLIIFDKTKFLQEIDNRRITRSDEKDAEDRYLRIFRKLN